MNIVSDTNVFLAAALAEPEYARIAEITPGADVIAPEILPYEIGNALSAMVKKKQITQDQALSAQTATGKIPVRLVSVNVREALKLAIQFDIYAYDAYFLTVAKSWSCPLITLDKKMRQVAGQMNLETLE